MPDFYPSGVVVERKGSDDLEILWSLSRPTVSIDGNVSGEPLAKPAQFLAGFFNFHSPSVHVTDLEIDQSELKSKGGDRISILD